MRKPTRLKIGAVIHGGAPRDTVLSALLYQCHSLQLTIDQWKWVAFISGEHATRYQTMRDEGRRKGADLDADGTIDERKQTNVETLIQILNEHCPDLCFFGMQPGDGCIGCWPDSDIIPFHEAGTDEIGKGNCLPSASIVQRDYWLTVNDHGNCTLYARQRCGRGWRWRECWSLV